MTFALFIPGQTKIIKKRSVARHFHSRRITSTHNPQHHFGKQKQARSLFSYPVRSTRYRKCLTCIDKRQTERYILIMKCLNWSTEKNEILKRERGICFEEIAYLIESDQIIGIEENAARPEQKIYILEIDNYAVVVPFVENDREIFLKTAFPSRKYTKRYGLKGE